MSQFEATVDRVVRSHFNPEMVHEPDLALFARVEPLPLHGAHTFYVEVM